MDRMSHNVFLLFLCLYFGILKPNSTFLNPDPQALISLSPREILEAVLTFFCVELKDYSLWMEKILQVQV